MDKNCENDNVDINNNDILNDTNEHTKMMEPLHLNPSEHSDLSETTHYEFGMHSAANRSERSDAAKEQEAVTEEDLEMYEEYEELSEEEIREFEKKERIKQLKSKVKARKRHERTFAHIFAGALLSVLIVSVSSILAVFIIRSALDFTGIGKAYCQAQIYINDDTNTEDVAKQLSNMGIINMPDVFKMYVNLTHPDADENYISGTFTVDTTMSYSVLLNTLQSVNLSNNTVEIRIMEGMTVDEIALLMEENKVCKAEDFMAECKKLEKVYKFQKRLENEPLKYYQMEGYIFPDTYEFYIINDFNSSEDFDTTENAKKVLDAIFENFNQKITGTLYNKMSARGLTLDETITLASIVQREADSVENMSKVASVFYNRLAESDVFPHLESDVTVLYVDNNIKIHGCYDKSIFDAYDTYTCDGIPVGPICNPGLDAIKAVIYAEDTDYYYFCADPETTEMYFAETIEEHEQNLIECGLEDAIAD